MSHDDDCGCPDCEPEQRDDEDTVDHGYEREHCAERLG